MSPNPAAPPFVILANEPSVTDAALRTLMKTPHDEMPALVLHPDQIDDVVAYIRSLKAP
jgi:hypothetical protein